MGRVSNPPCRNKQRGEIAHSYEENFLAIKADVSDLAERARHFGRKLAFGMSAHVVSAETLGEAQVRAEELAMIR